MNTTDGGLHFQAGIDWSIWDKDVQKLRQDVQASMKFAYEQSGLLDEAFANVTQGASDVEKALAEAGISFEQLVSGNMLETLKAANIEFGKTGAELRQAANDADKFVSGMEGALKQLVEEQQAVLEQIMEMPAGDAKDSAIAEFAAITAEIQESSVTVQKFREFVSDIKDDAKSVSQRFNETREQMERLVAAGKGGTEEYRELAAEAVRLKEAQELVNKEIQAMTKPQGLEGIISGMTLLTSSIGLAQGAISLFGAENERLNEIMLRLQALMSVTIGLQELQKQVAKDGAFGINVLAKAKEFWAVANTRVATALGITNAQATILMGTLTLGLSVAIGAVIYLFDQWAAKQDEIAKQQQELNKAIADSVAEPMVAYKRLQAQWNALGDDINTKKKFITEHKEEFDKLGVSVENVTDAENILRSKSTEFVEAMMLRAEAAAHAKTAVDEYQKAIQAEKDYERIYQTPGGITNWEFAERVLTGFGKRREEDRLKGRNYRVAADKHINTELDLIRKAEEVEKRANFKKANVSKNNSKPNSNKATSPAQRAKNIAEEILPEGSVAEIQKRLKAIDDALTKATNEKHIAALKERRMATAIELAEAEKRIQIQSIQQQVEQGRKLWEQYYAAVASLGKEKADQLYAGLLKEGNPYDKLGKMRDELLAKPVLTDEERDGLKIINDEIAKMLGQKSELEQFTEKMRNALEKLPTLAEQLEYLRNLRDSQYSDGVSKGFYAVADTEYQNRLKEAQNMYQQLLNEQQTYLEKQKALDEKYARMRSMAKTDLEKAKIEEAYKKEAGALASEMLKASNDWSLAFGNLDSLSKAAIERIIKRLEEFRDANKENLQPTEMRELNNALDKLRQKANTNPFGNVKKAIEAWAKANEDLAEATREVNVAQEEYNDTVSKYGKDSEQAILAQMKLQRATEKLSVAQGKQAEAMQGVSQAFAIAKAYGTKLVDAISVWIDAFGGMSEAAQNTVEDISAIMESLDEGFQAYMSGDFVSMAISIVKSIGLIVKALNGEKKRERQIKQMAIEVNKLKTEYEALGHAVERALGSDVYAAQQEQIKNLQKQLEVVQQMRKKEDEKKKTDKNKLNDYDSQILSLQKQIEDIQNSIVRNILQTDAKDAASKLGDALVDAFSRGEDASKSMRDVANNMIKDIVKNALKMRLETATKPLLDSLLSQMGFDEKGVGSFKELSPEQIKEFQNKVVAIGQQQQAFLEAWQQLFQGLEGGNLQGLKGDIKGVTEKTAGALEAQINAMRVNQVSGLEVMRNSLLQLSQIEANTRNLIEIRKDIKELNQKTKAGLAGI